MMSEPSRENKPLQNRNLRFIHEPLRQLVMITPNKMEQLLQKLVMIQERLHKLVIRPGIFHL